MPRQNIPETLEKLTVPVEGLTPYGGNPRRGNVTAIIDSLQFHGQYRPIVVRYGTNEVLAGNHTLEAVRQLGWADIAATFVDVDDDTAARIVLVDNRSNDVAGYDEEQLRELLGGLPDLAGTGFDDDFLSEMSREAEEEAGNSTLVERFGAPPFTVLDARQGPWQARKRAWRSMGIESEVGRDDDLIYTAAATQYQNWYKVKESAEAKAGRHLTEAEILEEYAGDLVPMVGLGTSIFDPVLCELMFRWYSPPGGHVLDPWAGGSVRGLVAARLGRKYTGVELRGEQVEANRGQTHLANGPLPAFLAAAPGMEDTQPGPAAAEDFTPDLTPVEEHGGFWVKREDAWSRGGASGAKARAMFTAAEGAAGLITAGARNSAQIERGALVARALAIPCVIHTGAGMDTAEVVTARSAGADVRQHKPGRLSVIKARYRTGVEEYPDYAAFPFGMDHPAYLEQVAEQVQNLPPEARRIVVPFGSGMTLAGVVRGVRDHGVTTPILAVSVGQGSTDYLDRHAPAWRDHVQVVEHPGDYSDPAVNLKLGDLTLDPIYEAKCLEYLEPGDVLWTVGLRRSAERPAGQVNDAPLWIEGESAETLEQLPGGADYDMLIGCPPYYDLETYGDDPRDMSNLTHQEFDAAMIENVKQAAARLKDDAYAVFIVGAVRNKAGRLLDMRSLMVRAGEEAGLTLHNDCILVTSLGTAAFRAARSFTATRVLARTHQDVLIFLKGDRKRAAAKMSTTEVEATLETLEEVEPDDSDG